MPVRILIYAILLGGCSLSTANPSQTPISIIDPTPQPINPVGAWEMLAQGLERRVYLPTSDNEITQFTALRIDPAYYTFRVHYRPGAPLTIREWAIELGSAVAFINANFFDPNDEILGLLIADGVVHGSPYLDRGGMFAVQNGQAHVRSNLIEPYGGEPLEQAIQAFPMLMLQGDQAYTDPAPDRFTRRTVVAEDGNGRIVMMATPLIGLPLLDLSAYLPTTDMNLVNALNLDGGGSTLMYVNVSGNPEYLVTSLDPVPAVLAVYSR